jgi:hypothetical protein
VIHYIFYVVPKEIDGAAVVVRNMFVSSADQIAGPMSRFSLFIGFVSPRALVSTSMTPPSQAQVQWARH